MEAKYFATIHTPTEGFGIVQVEGFKARQSEGIAKHEEELKGLNETTGPATVDEGGSLESGQEGSEGGVLRVRRQTGRGRRARRGGARGAGAPAGRDEDDRAVLVNSLVNGLREAQSHLHDEDVNDEGTPHSCLIHAVRGKCMGLMKLLVGYYGQSGI